MIQEKYWWRGARAYLPKLAGRYSRKASFKKSWVRLRSCVKPSGSLVVVAVEGVGRRWGCRKEIRTRAKKKKNRIKSTTLLSLKEPPVDSHTDGALIAAAAAAAAQPPPPCR